MARIKMTIEYDGSAYHGFQIQNNANTIQAEIQGAIKRISKENVSILCAGRTDAGVHAQGQVIAFDSNSNIPGHNWSLALNSFLPPDIKAISSMEADPDFHPRFHAKSKIYHYIIYREQQGVVFKRNYALCCTKSLNLPAMQDACRVLQGKHNFKSFCASGHSAKTFERNIMNCQIQEEGSYLKLKIEADGFLYNMVRIITGTLLEIGAKVHWANNATKTIEKILAAQDRTQAGPTAPPQGLYLVKVKY
ncbi:MAG: tRNA pseudouridine(38-40) synthase TruA [Syntrophomonadaceae bacterium]